MQRHLLFHLRQYHHLLLCHLLLLQHSLKCQLSLRHLLFILQYLPLPLRSLLLRLLVRYQWLPTLPCLLLHNCLILLRYLLTHPSLCSPLLCRLLPSHLLLHLILSCIPMDKPLCHMSILPILVYSRTTMPLRSCTTLQQLPNDILKLWLYFITAFPTPCVIPSNFIVN